MSKAEYIMIKYGYCTPKSIPCFNGNHKCSECGLLDWYEHHYNFEKMS